MKISRVIIQTIFFSIIVVSSVYAQNFQGHTYRGEERLKLQGHWKLYWKKLETSSFNSLDSTSYILIEKPGAWNGLEFQNEILTASGFATYYTEIESDIDYDSIALYLPGFYSSHRAYVNGEKVNQRGQVGVSRDSSEVDWVPQVVPIKLMKGKNELVLQISNFNHSKGGFYVDVELGKWTYFDSARTKNWLIDTFSAGAFFMIGFFFLGMFLFWRPSRQYIIYALFTIAYAIRILSSGNHILKSLFPEIPWQWSVGIEYFTLYLVFWTSLEVISKYLSSTAHRLISIYYLALTLSIVVLPLDIYSRILSFAIVSGLSIYLWIVYSILRKRKSMNVREYLSVLLFMVFALLGWVFEILIHNNEVGIFLLDPNLFRFLAVLVLGFVVAERYSTDYDQLEILKEEAISSKETIESQVEELNDQKAMLTERNQKIETLFGEVHHRVKNNLQLISSLLDVDDPETGESINNSILDDSRGRVATMSLIHQSLYMNDYIQMINLGAYISDLIDQLIEIHDFQEHEVVLNIPEIEFDVDTIVPLGLIVTELVTNSFKHATAKNRKLLLEVTYKKDEEGLHSLELYDNGDPLPDRLEVLARKGYGLRLASRLSMQLMGRLEHNHDQGNRFVLYFSDTEMRKAVL